jgi:anti-anti-sigma factor
MLGITSDNLGDITVLRCIGRIAFGYADRLLIAISKQPLCRITVLDLASVTDMDAAGIGTLVAARELAKVRGITLRLMNLTPRVEDLLELTHLRSIFEICSVAEMLNLLCRAFEPSEPVNVDDVVETSLGYRARDHVIGA